MATEVAPPPTVPADERVRRSGALAKLFKRPEIGALVGVVVVWIFFAIVAHSHNFISWATTSSILNRAAPLGILAVAVSLLMIAGEFDLSVGSIIGFSGMVIMVLVTPTTGGGFGWALWPAVGISLLFALTTGLFNGAIVITTKLPSFIVTLGSLFAFRGVTIAVTRLLTDRAQVVQLDVLAA